MTQTNQFDEVAAFLSEQRKTKRITTKKASAALFIPESTLSKLEHPQKLDMEPTQALALYKQYGRYLQVGDRKLKRFLPEEVTSDTQVSHQRIKPTKIKRWFVLSKISLGLVSAAVVVSIAGYAVWQALQLGAAPKLTIAQPESRQIIRKNPVMIKGESEEDVTVLVGGDPVTLNNGTFEVEVFLQEGHNVVEVTAVNNFSRETTKELTLFLETDESSVPSVDEQG